MPISKVLLLRLVLSFNRLKPINQLTVCRKPDLKMSTPVLVILGGVILAEVGTAAFFPAQGRL